MILKNKNAIVTGANGGLGNSWLMIFGQNVEIKSGSVVESHCYVGKDSSIGRNCRIFPGVKILSHCEVMDRVILNA